jgi:hypothetical protein
LAAVAALLGLPRDWAADLGGPDRLITVALDGVERLAADPGQFAPGRQPDTAAVEYLIPALLERVHGMLAAQGQRQTPRLADHIPGGRRAGLSSAVGAMLAACEPFRQQLAGLRAACLAGGPLPGQISHTQEILDLPTAQLEGRATELPVGCSAAATAALAARATRPCPEAVELLGRQASALDGALPVICQMTTFERLWTLAPLIRFGVPVPDKVRRLWARWLREVITPDGVRAGPGLPPDGDDTAVALYLAGRLGTPIEPTAVMGFVTDAGVASYPDERTGSTTTNAHALEAISLWARCQPTRSGPIHTAQDSIRELLLGAQEDDGSWNDKWHASPLYAISCVAPALHTFGSPPTRAAVARSINWVLAAQHANGGWGMWGSTVEETAFALHALLLSGEGEIPPAVTNAVSRGRVYLTHAATSASPCPPMWLGKELYGVPRITHAYLLAILK